jgi:hypothetical protein
LSLEIDSSGAAMPSLQEISNTTGMGLGWIFASENIIHRSHLGVVG